jgi:hypothetical protein
VSIVGDSDLPVQPGGGLLLGLRGGRAGQTPAYKVPDLKAALEKANAAGVAALVKSFEATNHATLNEISSRPAGKEQ